MYTDNGYIPATLKIQKGETITFENQSSKAMWTASDIHTTHRLYAETSLSEHCGSNKEASAFDACGGVQPGDSWSFTFDQPGNWKYHNHLFPRHIGKLLLSRKTTPKIAYLRIESQ